MNESGLNLVEKVSLVRGGSRTGRVAKGISR